MPEYAIGVGTENAPNEACAHHQNQETSPLLRNFIAIRSHACNRTGPESYRITGVGSNSWNPNKYKRWKGEKASSTSNGVKCSSNDCQEKEYQHMWKCHGLKSSSGLELSHYFCECHHHAM